MARYIDADKLKEDLEEARAAGMIDMYSCEQRECNFDEAIECVDIQPTADVQPVVHGKWSRLSFGVTAQICSVCENLASIKFNYCPNCGARMDGDTE